MTYVLKFDYESDRTGEPKTKMLCFKLETEARKYYDQIALFFSVGVPLRVKGGREVDLLGVSLFWAASGDYRAAVTEVNDGKANLLEKATEIEIDLDL